MAVYETLLRVYGETVANSFRDSGDNSLGSAVRAITQPSFHSERLLEGKIFDGHLDRGIIHFDSSRTDPKNSLI